MKLAYIPAGEFLMGSPDSDTLASSDEKPQHRVQIAEPFYLGVHEVTQAEYEKVVGRNPSSFRGESLPVERVSWDDAVEFCKRLSELPAERAAGRTYRLPTEAEWEYACRAGTTTKYSFGDDPNLLGEYGWFDENCDKRSHPVGTKKPNPWSLHDMHGNVWEWCQATYDWQSPAADPAGRKPGVSRVFRGGCWCNGAETCRSAGRSGRPPAFRNDNLGFRVARSKPGK